MNPHTVTALALSLAAASPALGAIVYQARSTPATGVLIICEPDETDSAIELAGGPIARETDSRIGDTITLAGTDRYVTSFSTRLWAFDQPFTNTITLDVELTLYQNAAGLPGAAIWSGTLSAISFTGNQPRIIAFQPNVFVPNSLCFSLAYHNIVQTGGLRTFGVVGSFGPAGPAFGSSTQGFIRQDTATQAWRTDNPLVGGLTQIDAVIEAVPTPSTLAIAIPVFAVVLRRPSRRDGTLTGVSQAPLIR